MKKYLFPLAIAACTALVNTSCSSSDPVPPAEQEYNGEFIKPDYAEQAAAFVLPIDEVKDQNGKDAYLNGINITESGKAIFEVKTQDGKTKFATYNAVIEGNTYYIVDDAGNPVGTVVKAATKATQDVTIKILIVIYVDGELYTFEVTVTVPMLVPDPNEASRQTNNLCRTWEVAQMNIVLDGDVNVSKIVADGNMEEFLNAALDAGAKLTDSEKDALRKHITSMTFDKNGLFSIEYSDGPSDGCSWEWTDKDKQESIHLKHRNGAEFGNKFLSNESDIRVDFTPTSVALTLETEIKGNQNYKATLTIVLK